MRPILLKSNKEICEHRNEHAVSWKYSQGTGEHKHKTKRGDFKSQQLYKMQGKKEQNIPTSLNNTSLHAKYYMMILQSVQLNTNSTNFTSNILLTVDHIWFDYALEAYNSCVTTSTYVISHVLATSNTTFNHT